MLLQAVVWQKSRVSDHRAALMAVLGAACVANLLPVQHRQEQPEVSEAQRKHGHIYHFHHEQRGSTDAPKHGRKICHGKLFSRESFFPQNLM